MALVCLVNLFQPPGGLVFREPADQLYVSLEEIDSNNVFFTLLQFTLYHEGLLKELGAQGFEYREVVERIESSSSSSIFSGEVPSLSHASSMYASHSPRIFWKMPSGQGLSVWR